MTLHVIYICGLKFNVNLPMSYFKTKNSFKDLRQLLMDLLIIIQYYHKYKGVSERRTKFKCSDNWFEFYTCLY